MWATDRRGGRVKPVCCGRLCAAVALTATLASLLGETLFAQGITTASISGSVRSADDTPLDGSSIRVENGATGFAVDVESRGGRFFISGLPVGGPYTVSVRRLGFVPKQVPGLVL